MPKYANNIHNVRSWFARSIANAVIDHYRSHGRRAVAVGSAADLDLIADEWAQFHRPSPEESLVVEQRLTETLRRLDRLPDRLRAVMVQRFLEEKSYTEIAKTLSITEALVRKRVQEARTLLRH
jgi:RNA polymerase sigma-70 factor (ECF subfamily)